MMHHTKKETNMEQKSSKAKRYVVDCDAVRKLASESEVSKDTASDEYSPVLQTPNFIRKLGANYSVYHKDTSSAF